MKRNPTKPEITQPNLQNAKLAEDRTNPQFSDRINSMDRMDILNPKNPDNPVNPV